MSPGRTPGRIERDEYGRLTRNGLVLEAAVQVDGVDDTGARVVTFDLDHGDDPARVLRELGWQPRLVAAERHVADEQALLITYAVRPLPGGPEPYGEQDVRIDAGIDVAQVPMALVRRRLAAYAVTTSTAGLLLSQNSELTNSPGSWALPGGGIDPGEAPIDAVIREVWEETGQHVVIGGLEDIVTRRWIGLSPKGVLEDFQAFRLIYRATCPEPTTPIVHDVGGTTAAAAWVPRSQWDGVEFTGRVGDVVRRVLG